MYSRLSTKEKMLVDISFVIFL